jgi:DNA modification methylase
MRIIKRVRKLTEKLFLLSRIDDKEELKDRGLEDIEITQSYGNLIREPNNVFDIVVIPYLIDTGIDGMSIVDLLKEGYRIIKENGFLLTFIGRTPPRTKHRILNRITEIHNRAFEGRLFSKKDIINHLKDANIKNYEFFKYGYQLILIIRKSESSKK